MPWGETIEPTPFDLSVEERQSLRALVLKLRSFLPRDQESLWQEATNAGFLLEG